MCEVINRVNVWCMLETAWGAWIGEGSWPIPDPDGEAEMLSTIYGAVLDACNKVVKGSELLHITLMVNNVCLRPLQDIMAKHATLTGLADRCAEQMVWHEVPHFAKQEGDRP